MEAHFAEACLRRRIDILRQLLADPQTDPNFEYGAIFTLLYYTCEFQWVDGLKLLLKHERIDVNNSPSRARFQTPLYVACEKGYAEIVELLLGDERLDVNKAEENGRTPFYIACKNGFIEVVKLLLNDDRLHVDLEEKLNGKTLIEVAREKEPSRTGKHDEVSKTRDYESVIELLESYQRNPIETKTKLRGQLEIWFDRNLLFIYLFL